MLPLFLNVCHCVMATPTEFSQSYYTARRMFVLSADSLNEPFWHNSLGMEERTHEVTDKHELKASHSKFHPHRIVHTPENP
jgi:hypothetical protein